MSIQERVSRVLEAEGGGSILGIEEAPRCIGWREGDRRVFRARVRLVASGAVLTYALVED